jgi:L-malate glycosyltransferase
MLGSLPGWVPNPAEELASRLGEHGYTCLLTSRFANRYRRLADILLSIARHHRHVDILCLQVYGGPSFVIEDIASSLARLLGLRVVMVLHGGAMPEFMRGFPRWTRHVFARAHRFVTSSGFLSDAITPYGFQATTIPNAIPIENYSYQQRKKIRPSILWMRTFHKIYNPHMAVDVLGCLVHDFPNVLLTMAGQEKGCLDEIKAQVYEMGLESRVRFAGFLDATGKQAEFSKHDVFINTNRVDNMPVSLIEASAFGMPIVATAVGGIPYMIRDGENGLLVPDADANAMAGAIRRLIEEPDLVGRLSKNGRSFAEAHGWSAVLPMWKSLFQDVMGQSI